MKRRSANVFSLAFLDVMLCGFGAVILFFMIINANTYERREKINYNITGEVKKLDVEVKDAEIFLVELKISLQEVNDELVETQGRTHEVIKKLSKRKFSSQG
ncbi:MAG: hypothetical protein KJO47_00040 [Gammaproteobacteria bacterium]|nr:hypothetical protein [Gammaproteobacteria bacterium]